jgi:hypothetical protein
MPSAISAPELPTNPAKTLITARKKSIIAPTIVTFLLAFERTSGFIRVVVKLLLRTFYDIYIYMLMRYAKKAPTKVIPVIATF